MQCSGTQELEDFPTNLAYRKIFEIGLEGTETFSSLNAEMV